MKFKSLFIEDMTPDQISVVESRMRPGEYSIAGFLDRNESLIEVIQRDTETLKRYGITHKQIGDYMESLDKRSYEQEKRAGIGCLSTDAELMEFRQAHPIDEIFVVSNFPTMGFQFCPFYDRRRPYNERCGDGSSVYNVANTSTGENFWFADIMPHLIRDHRFFEGNTHYRVDPEGAIRVLEIKPETGD